AGRAKHALRFAEMIAADFAVMHKTRPAHDVAEVTEVTGRVAGKIAIVGDDATMTGGTLLAGAKTLKEHGATDVWLFVTHALLTKEGLIPGVLYGRGNAPHPICVPERELRKALTGPAGTHAILDVTMDGQESSHASILKEAQQDPVRGRLLHIDLQEVRLDQPIQA